MTTYERGKLYEISIIDFKLDPDQPRKVIDPDALAELTASIKTHGILQPLLFRQGDQGWLYIVSGERRYRAAKELGLLTLPAMLVEGNHAEIALVENLLRQDLTAVEEAEALQRLKDDQQYTDEQLSGVIGRARTTLSDILLISRLPAEIRDEARGDRKVAKSTLIEIARKKQARAMITAWTKYKEKQAKAAAGSTRQEKAPATPEELIDWVSKTNAKLAAIDANAWTGEEQAAFTEALAALQETIGGLLPREINLS